MKVLWLSRHEMTEQQQRALMELLEDSFEVTARNVTFPARATEAAREIISLAKGLEINVIAGVFPAHVAAQLALVASNANVEIFIPVAVPAPAKEGEVRGGGFEFSHWEMF